MFQIILWQKENISLSKRVLIETSLQRMATWRRRQVPRAKLQYPDV